MFRPIQDAEFMCTVFKWIIKLTEMRIRTSLLEQFIPCLYLLPINMESLNANKIDVHLICSK